MKNPGYVPECHTKNLRYPLNGFYHRAVSTDTEADINQNLTLKIADPDPRILAVEIHNIAEVWVRSDGRTTEEPCTHRARGAGKVAIDSFVEKPVVGSVVTWNRNNTNTGSWSWRFASVEPS